MVLLKDDDDEYAGEDDEEEEEPNGVSARLMSPLIFRIMCWSDHWLIATSWWTPDGTTLGRDSGKWIDHSGFSFQFNSQTLLNLQLEGGWRRGGRGRR